MKGRLVYSLPFVLLLSLVGLFWLKLGTDPRVLPSTLIDKPLPTLEGVQLNGTAFKPSEWKGQVVVLNVWASWCQACHLSHPFLMDLALKKTVKVVGLDYKDSRSGATHWLAEFGNPYSECLYDPSGEKAMQLGVYGMPETFLIGPSGRVRFKHIGVLNQVIWDKEFAPRIARMHA